MDYLIITKSYGEKRDAVHPFFTAWTAPQPVVATAGELFYLVVSLAFAAAVAAVAALALSQARAAAVLRGLFLAVPFRFL
jgi:hypothetical protein